VGLGLSFISDKIGPVTEQNVYGDFSYTLKLNDTHRLALGLKAGVSFHKVGLETFNLLYLILKESFGEDINDASLNLEQELLLYG
jgi:hypothetical protein